MKPLQITTMAATLLSSTIINAHQAKHLAGDGEDAVKKPAIKNTLLGSSRRIQSNGIANHQTGKFPNPRNPHEIEPQGYKFKVSSKPKTADQSTPVKMHIFGIAVNGVPFDPGTAEFWNGDPRSGWRYEALSGKIDLGVDIHHAHVQPNGSYHYHGMPVGLIKNLIKQEQKMVLIGWAADGFPIYAKWGSNDLQDPTKGITEMKSSYVLKEGKRPGEIDPATLEGKDKRKNSGDKEPGGNYDGTFIQDYEYKKGAGDLDEANGKFGITPEYPKGIYHYYITENFPFIPRMFKGTPDKSFIKRGPRENKGRGPGGGPPRKR